MQIGMIGLGRMGANMVRRLLRDGHECVVYDINADNVEELVKEGAEGADSLDHFASLLEKPRTAWLMLPAAIVGGERRQPGDADGARRHHRRRRQFLLSRCHRHRPAHPQRRRPFRRRRHERRRLGARARLLPDDRRCRRRRCSISTRSSRPWRPAARAGRRPKRATSTAARPARGISSRWCTTASNTASWPPMPRA